MFTPLGILFVKEDNNNLYYYTKKLIYGLILASFIAILLNFFFPLNKPINSILIIICTVILFFNWKKYFNKEYLLFITLSGILISLLIIVSNVYRPDAGLYHLPYIGILNSEKIIVGISNLHTRYGLISITQYLSAITNNYIFGENGIVFAQALIANAVILNFSFQIFKYNKIQKYNFHFFFILFCFIYFFYKMNRYSEYGNDAPAHYLLFFLISELILQKEKFKLNDFLNNLLLSLFIIQSKLTLIFLVFFHLINIKNLKISSLIRNFRFYFLVFFTFIWIFKNILTTGCLLYPIKTTCINGLSWVDIKKVEAVSESAEVWTKGWSDQSKIEITEKEFLKNFVWIKAWSSNQLKYIINIITPYIIFCILIILYISMKQNRKEVKLEKNIKYYFLIIFCSCIFWMLKSPLYRYGYSYIISMFAFIFSLYLTKFHISKDIKKMVNIILIFGFSIIIIKNSVRIYENKQWYNNFPWPKYYSMDKENKKGSYKINYLNSQKILTPNNEYCMYVKKICSHYKISNKLKILKKFGYLVIYEN